MSQKVSKWLVNGLFHLLINGVYWGYNPPSNHILTSWDIQVPLIGPSPYKPPPVIFLSASPERRPPRRSHTWRSLGFPNPRGG